MVLASCQCRSRSITHQARSVAARPQLMGKLQLMQQLLLSRAELGRKSLVEFGGTCKISTRREEEGGGGGVTSRRREARGGRTAEGARQPVQQWGTTEGAEVGGTGQPCERSGSVGSGRSHEWLQVGGGGLESWRRVRAKATAWPDVAWGRKPRGAALNRRTAAAVVAAAAGKLAPAAPRLGSAAGVVGWRGCSLIMHPDHGTALRLTAAARRSTSACSGTCWARSRTASRRTPRRSPGR